MPSFQVITFGCKVNQYESAAMAEALETLGFAPGPPGAGPDLVIVNTCTVTARADQQARQAIRRLARQYPGARLWVTGCYAQRDPLTLSSLPGVARVWGNREKLRLAAMVGSAGWEDGGPLVQVQALDSQEPFQPLPVSRFPGHTRAWLKVQDGCSHACSYCIVPSVRGPGRSLAPESVLSSLETLAARGFQEVVLTGIDLGQYGRDLAAPEDLAGLLRRLARTDWPWRLRLSSLEPQEITAELAAALSALPGLCPHFHLPMQSGSPGVLRAMGRPYQPEHFRELVMDLHRRFPTAALGLDVLVGFPGESAADFEATRRLVEALPVAYLHVFPFSPRPGTPAQALRRLPGKEVQRRAKVMQILNRNKKAAFYQGQVGQVGEVLVEGPVPGRPGWLKGLSANYLRVLLPGPEDWRNRRLNVRFLQVAEGMLVSEVLGSGRAVVEEN
uniref:tRNA (N(6)-L-threonylcarbamoyladenosine(37)-C(2))-methylthiotransferase MtaB n=1 Tax=Desulfobacca acetoxidans TaxID=60893 RepID=A0A7C3UWE9_9BACT